MDWSILHLVLLVSAAAGSVRATPNPFWWVFPNFDPNDNPTELPTGKERTAELWNADPLALAAGESKDPIKDTERSMDDDSSLAAVRIDSAAKNNNQRPVAKKHRINSAETDLPVPGGGGSRDQTVPDGSGGSSESGEDAPVILATHGDELAHRRQSATGGDRPADKNVSNGDADSSTRLEATGTEHDWEDKSEEETDADFRSMEEEDVREFLKGLDEAATRLLEPESKDVLKELLESLEEEEKANNSSVPGGLHDFKNWLEGSGQPVFHDELGSGDGRISSRKEFPLKASDTPKESAEEEDEGGSGDSTEDLPPHFLQKPNGSRIRTGHILPKGQVQTPGRSKSLPGVASDDDGDFTFITDNQEPNVEDADDPQVSTDRASTDFSNEGEEVDALIPTISAMPCHGTTQNFKLEIHSEADVVEHGSHLRLQCHLHREINESVQLAPLRMSWLFSSFDCLQTSQRQEDCRTTIRSDLFQTWNHTSELELYDLHQNDSGTYFCELSWAACIMPNGTSINAIQSLYIKVYMKPHYETQLGIILALCFALLAILLALFAYSRRKQSHSRAKYNSILAANKIQISPTKTLELPNDARVYMPTTFRPQNGSLGSARSSFSSTSSRENV